MMLDVCQANNRTAAEGNATMLKSFNDISQMVKYKRDGGSACKNLDNMDKKGQRSIGNPNLRKKGIETASTSPESNSVALEYSAGFGWNGNPVVTELKDVNGDINAKGTNWTNQGWSTSQSDLMSTNSCTNCSIDEGMRTTRKTTSEVHYNKHGTSEGSYKDVSAENMDDVVGDDRLFNKAWRSNSFSGTVTYACGTAESTDNDTLNNTAKHMPMEAGISYAPTQYDSMEIVSQYILDLRKKQLANVKYPEEAVSYTNNKFVYQNGPIGFPTTFRDTECMELVRSTSCTAPLTVFTAFSPSQLEDNAIAVDVGDKVDIVARLNRWLYVRIAKSAHSDAIGRSGWIPEHALLEPEIFTRQLHHPRLHTHTFNKFI